MEEPKVVNIVASASLNFNLELREIADVFEEAEYDKSRFPGLIYRMEKPKVAILLFTSGKLVCTGAKSIDQTKKAINVILERIRDLFKERHPEELDNIPESVDVEIQNIVATGNLNTVLNLNKAAIYLSFDKVEYEPEQFPGLVYRLDKPKVVALLFGSGKVVCTGARNTADIKDAVTIITEELKDIGLI